MALSQLQCLDENHVNPRTNESKPDFLYCEDQRLALETLLRDGREAFFKFLESRDQRGFLSDPELETLCSLAEPYQPDSDLFPENAEEGDPPLSLHYWPDLSDTSAPQMELGWPDSASYRGVTRTTVYCQPPIDDQAHIKEVVRRMIAQAQKVIAVVMDVFTDVDIFRDLLDVGFKKRVSVYILLDRTALPHFLSMCQRANMHTGHLKHLRVRCSEGSGFYTRSSTRLRGRLGHRFMFVDGDKAVSGSYSFTWMSSRLDRNVITVVTGQAVETFEKLFRNLYANSSSVDLRQVAMVTEPEPEPEKDPLPLPATVALTSIAMKLYNPKYALALCSPSIISTVTPAVCRDGVQSDEISKEPGDHKKKRGRGAGKESHPEPPPLHPCLSSLEKVCLISFLPTWPEPDPPSDVIGLINIRDTSKPLQAHLLRSEMFETSKVIRFSSPINIPKEVLPMVAKPRQFIATQNKVKKLSQGQTTAREEPHTWPGGIKRKLEHNTPNYEMQHNSVRNPQYEHNINIKESGHVTSTTPRLTTPTDSLIPPGSNAKVCESHVIVCGSSRTQTSPPTREPIDSSTGQSVQVIKMTPNLQTSKSSSPTHACLSLSSSPALPPSSQSLSPPTPKPRTVQLVIKDTVHDDGQKRQEVSIVRRQQTNTGKLQNCNESVREGKLREAHKNARGNYQETKIEEVVHDVKANPETKQASKSGDLRADDQDKVHKDEESTLDCVTTPQLGNTERDQTDFESKEVIYENRKNVVKQKPKISGGHTLHKIQKTAPKERITSVDATSRAPDTCKPNLLADVCTGANRGALNGCNISEELPPNSHANTSPSEISPSSNQSDNKVLHLCIPDREPPPLGRTPYTPSSDPRLRTPESRARTPDFQTPTSDFSDEFALSRTLSTASDEYYECSDFPFNEAFENADDYSRDMREEDFRSSRATTADTSNISACADHVSTSKGNTSINLAETASASSLSFLDPKSIKVTNGSESIDLEMRVSGGKRAQRRGGDESKSTDTFKHSKTLTEIPSQETNVKSPSKAERLDEGGITSEEMESESSSKDDTRKERIKNSILSSSPVDNKVIKPKDMENERESVGLERTLDVEKRAQRIGEESKGTTDTFKNGKNLTEVLSDKNRKTPSKAGRLDERGVSCGEMESKPPSTGDTCEEKMTARNDKRDGIRGTKEQKLSHTLLQQDRGAGSPSPRTIQAQSRTLPHAPPVSDNTRTPERSPKPPPPPAEGRRQTAKTRQRQHKSPNPKSQNSWAQPIALHPHPDSQRPTSGEAQCQVGEKTLFSSTFGCLSSLKDKINKLPAQSKRGGTSSSAQTRKSSS